MTKNDAYRAGRRAAFEMATHLFGKNMTNDIDRFVSEVIDAEENSRQYAGHISYEIARQSNAESLFDAYDCGVSEGANAAFRRMMLSGVRVIGGISFRVTGTMEIDGIQHYKIRILGRHGMDEQIGFIPVPFIDGQ